MNNNIVNLKALAQGVLDRKKHEKKIQDNIAAVLRKDKINKELQEVLTFGLIYPILPEDQKNAMLMLLLTNIVEAYAPLKVLEEITMLTPANEILNLNFGKKYYQINESSPLAMKFIFKVLKVTAAISPETLRDLQDILAEKLDDFDVNKFEFRNVK